MCFLRLDHTHEYEDIQIISKEGLSQKREILNELIL
jgi:hypothetical protein